MLQYDSQIRGKTYTLSSLLNASSNCDAVAILNTPLHDHVIFIHSQLTQIDSKRPQKLLKGFFLTVNISYCINEKICEVQKKLCFNLNKV